MTLRHCTILVAALGLGAGGALAQPAGGSSGESPTQPGRDLAQTCRVCHGLDGVGTNPMIPNIGGQSAEYLSKQMQDFRAGRREDPQMTIIARDLTDDEIMELAAWYASIEATYVVPD